MKNNKILKQPNYFFLDHLIWINPFLEGIATPLDIKACHIFSPHWQCLVLSFLFRNSVLGCPSSSQVGLMHPTKPDCFKCVLEYRRQELSLSHFDVVWIWRSLTPKYCVSILWCQGLVASLLQSQTACGLTWYRGG
jgi:hypothetical protein